MKSDVTLEEILQLGAMLCARAPLDILWGRDDTARQMRSAIFWVAEFHMPHGADAFQNVLAHLGVDAVDAWSCAKVAYRNRLQPYEQWADDLHRCVVRLKASRRRAHYMQALYARWAKDPAQPRWVYGAWDQKRPGPLSTQERQLYADMEKVA